MSVADNGTAAPRAAVLAAAAALLVLGGAALLLRSPWHDELYTAELAGRSAADILRALRLDSGPPGHYLVAWLLTRLGAGSVLWLRLPSLLGVVVGAVFVVRAAGRVVPTAAWPAAALLAAHPLLLAAAAEARAYGLLFAVVAGAVLLLTGPLDHRRTVALAILLAAAGWLHALGLVVAGAVFVAGFWRPPSERHRVWLAVLAALLLMLPWLPVMTGQPVAAVAWMHGAWVSLPWWRWLLPLMEPAPGTTVAAGATAPVLPAAVVAVTAVVWLVLVAAGAGRSRRVAGLAALWAAAAAALLAVTAAGRPVWAAGRSALVVLPAAVVVASVGAVRLRRLGWLAVGVLAAGGLAVDGVWISGWAGPAPDPAAGAARVLAAAAPGDVVVVTGWWYLDVRHALGSRRDGLQWLTFPAVEADHPGWYDDGLARVAAGELPVLQARLAEAQEQGHAVWLLRSPSLSSDAMLTPLAGALGLVPWAGEKPYWELWGPAPAAPAGGSTVRSSRG